MNQVGTKKLLLKNGKFSFPRIPKSAWIHRRAEIHGCVFIGEHAHIGTSKIFAEEDHIISIGNNTTIKDSVLIRAKDSKFEFNELGIRKVRDICIGNKVFISSEASIHGPALIADETFIGYHTTIVNSRIGSNCVIEDNVLIKNMLIPPDTFIPSRSVIDSTESIKEFLSNGNLSNYYELDALPRKYFSKVS